MEYHAVPPEERAKDEKGNLLPWSYVYKDESRNPRRPPEETGPFGKRRNTRYHSVRSATRTGTPAKRENPNVAEFSRLFALQLENEQAQQKHLPPASSSSAVDPSKKLSNKVATECILYGYKDKSSEWKVIDRFERISQGTICEDYPRSDPELNIKYPRLLSGSDVVIRTELSPDANQKAKRYAGGNHWIKVTFDSAAAADRACYYSPQEIDGFVVHCEIYHGQGPREDAPIAAVKTGFENWIKPKAHTVTPASVPFPVQQDEVDRATLPRSFTVNSAQVSAQPVDDANSVASQKSTATASSATVTSPPPESTLRQRQASQSQSSEFMTHIPTVRRAVLRPVSEALPPQPTLVERLLRSIPILSWFTGDIVGDGPVLREDGTFDYEKSPLYWRFWYTADRIFGTDLCGLKEEQ
ncbi:hypothetical protein VTO42DRAFT_7795 [Malbranchea cinnamomea]